MTNVAQQSSSASPVAARSVFRAADDGFTWQAPQQPLCWRGIHFVATLGDGMQLDSRDALVQPRPIAARQASYCLQWPLARAFHGELLITLQGSALLWKLQLGPEDRGPWSLARISEMRAEIDGWQDLSAARLFHADNLRGASRAQSLFDASYWIHMDELRRPLGSGRWQAFPGLWLHEPASGWGVVAGELSQDVWRHQQTVRQLNRCCLCWEGEFLAPGIDARPFHAGESYEGETLWLEMTHAQEPGRAFAHYLDELEQRISPAKVHSPLRQGFLWGSWNDRQPHFWDVDQRLIQRSTQAVVALFPAAMSVEVDGSIDYAGGETVEAAKTTWLEIEGEGRVSTDASVVQVQRRLGIGAFYERDYGLDHTRFPEGMKPVAALIAGHRLIPSLWIGMHVVHESQIVREHPEWFAQCRPNPVCDPELVHHFASRYSGTPAVLDPSVAEARQFIEMALDTVRDWGFRSTKLDFWSYGFENDLFRLAWQDKTAWEWRRWLLHAVRSRLPRDAFLELACDISTGNPFLGQYADNLRYGIDIGNGHWKHIYLTAMVGSFLLHCQAYRFAILNSDAVGCFENLVDSERQVLFAYCAVMRSLCELAGDIALKPRESLRLLQKLLLAPRNGAPAFVGEFEHLECNEPAAVIWSEGDNFSRVVSPHLPCRLLAVFNWSDAPRTLTVDPQNLRLAPGSTLWDADFFNPEDIAVREGAWKVTLPPRSVRLSHLSEAKATPAVLESDLRIDQINLVQGKMRLELAGSLKVGLTLVAPSGQEPVIESCSHPSDLDQLQPNIYRLRFDCGDAPETVRVVIGELV